MRMKLTSILLMIFLLGSGTLISASTGVIKGKIYDKDSKMALPGATISLNGNGKGTISSRNGNFTLTSVPAGDNEIQISYIGYTASKVNVKVNSDKTAFVEVPLVAGSSESDEIVVVGESLKGQAKSLNQQRTNPNLSNIVAADQIGKFPDANVGDAMKRIPGITVQYDQGEARFGLVRGTAARLNSVTINGERIPSAEAENREVQLDLVPADMVSSIEVSKVLTPDMDADAIGGSINLVTRSAPNGTRLSVTAGSGMNFLSEKPIWTGSAVLGNRFLNNKLGLIVSGSYHNITLGSDNVEAEWANEDGNVILGDLEVRKYDVQRVRQSISAGLDYELDNNNIFYLSTIYNHRNDWENRYRLRYRFSKGENDGIPNEDGTVMGTVLVRETKGGINNDANDNARLEDQRTLNFSLGGDHLFFNTLKMNWRTSYSKASEERPNERYISYETETEASPDISNTEVPMAAALGSGTDLNNWELDAITEEYQYTEDIDMNGRVDFQLPILSGKNSSNTKFGVRVRSKEKKRENNFFEYEPINDGDLAVLTDCELVDQTKDNFLAGDYVSGQFASNEFLGALNLENASRFKKTDVLEEYAAGNFDANENVMAAYFMYNQNIGKSFYFIAGFRVENTAIEYNANEFDIEEETIVATYGEDDYTNFLPALITRYNINDDMIVRASYTNTIARPNYFDLAPYREVNFEDMEMAEGNPALEPTKSMNLDLSIENYFKSIGLVSGGVFYKDIQDYIFGYTQKKIEKYGQVWDEYYQPRNGGAATMFGAEIAFQRQLDFLPGFLNGFGIYLNYTYTHSEVDGLPLEGREDEELGLPGTAENMINASLSYEKYGFTARVSVNYTSDYVDEFGDESFYDRYYDTQTFLDINCSYAITEQFRIFVDAQNLTNQPLSYYQGISGRLMQAEYYNSRINVGIKYDM